MYKLALLSFALLAAPALAHAENHTYPATACDVAYGEDQVVSWDDGGIYSNASTWWRTLMCPLPVDRENWLDRIQVRAYDRNYSLDVSCRVVSTDPASASTTWGAAAQTTGSGPQLMTLNVARGNARAGVYSNLLCYVPQTFQGARSGILGFGFDGVLW